MSLFYDAGRKKPASRRPIPSYWVALVWAGLAPASLGAGISEAEIETKVEALLRQMTLEEKLGQLQQLDGHADGKYRPEHLVLAEKGLLGSLLNVRGAKATNAVQRMAQQSRLKVPLLLGYDVIHGYRTIFPIPLGEASSWDPSLAEASAAVAAAEADAAGVKWTFAPMVDIARDPRWGRIAEGAGEDPFLGAAMARARVKGFQGDDPALPGKIMACAKHWVAYGAAEAGRDYNTVDVSERSLREVYFPPFRAAVEAGIGSFMSAFNDLNGVPASANRFTLTRVLRDEWGFRGLVVSDYNAVRELMNHGIAGTEEEAALAALSAGVDMEMVSQCYAKHVPGLLTSRKLSTEIVNEAVRRILRVKLRLGLFDHPYTDESSESQVLLNSKHLSLAREAAGRSMVLLRNESGILPLGKAIRSIAVIGPLADDAAAPLGPWSGDGRKEEVITLLAGIRERVGSGSSVTFARGCVVEGGDTRGFGEAVAIAKKADVAVVVVGETANMSGEAASRSSLDLPGNQLDLVKAVQATGTKTVVVLMNGRPLTIGWIAEHVPAVLEAWFPGTQAGKAVADVLFGEVNPGGKLPVTFPRAVGQVPLYYSHKSTGRPPGQSKYTSKYLDVPVTPLFSFGFGLSYTTFRLENLTLSQAQISRDGTLEVGVEVENAGSRAGDEVVQLYLTKKSASVTRPVKELRGFQRITLSSGERRRIVFRIEPKDRGFLDADLRFVVEPGEFHLTVGTSSEGGLAATFVVT